MIGAATGWIGLIVLYLCFAGDVSAVEVVSSIVCATAGTTLALKTSRIAHRQFARWPAARALLRPLAALVPETLAVGRQLVAAIFIFKDQRGAYIRQPFNPGGDDATCAGRRAAVLISVSLAPGSFVICGDRTDTMLIHALPCKRASSDPLWPA